LAPFPEIETQEPEMNARTIARFAATAATAAVLTLGAGQAAHASSHTAAAPTVNTVNSNPWE
jgi:hypothetical protein